MKHKLINKCEDNCGYCTICCSDYCEVCTGLDDTLTTDCCGRKLTTDEEIKVVNDTLDFINGEWVVTDRCGVTGCDGIITDYVLRCCDIHKEETLKFFDNNRKIL